MVWKACAAALLVLVAVPCDALPPNDVITTYFADAAKTKWVGEVELTCGGGIIKFGRTSQFLKKSSDSCRPGRMTPIAMSRFAGPPRDRVAACNLRCDVRFHHRPPMMCTPNACPTDALDEAAAQCHASCNELATGNQ